MKRFFVLLEELAARGNWWVELNAAFQAGVMRSAVVIGGAGAYKKNS